MDKLLFIFFVIHVIGAIATIEFHYKDGTLEWASKHGDGVRFSTPADVIMNDCICWEVYLLMRIIDFITDYINLIFEDNFKGGKKMSAENINCPRPGEQCNEFMCGSSVDGICHIENNCDFCNKIYDADELNNQYYADREVCDCITYDKDNNTYSFWNECVDDYYTGNIMEIKYCPICGRKL